MTYVTFPVQRLRGEARLLRQKMDALETECGKLADNLLQGQVRHCTTRW